jgi:sn-glycerol 3-phosphate transport system permease protein
MRIRASRPYLMIAPAMGVFSVFSLYPVAYMCFLSLFKWNLMGPKRFIGLKNYADLFASAEFARIAGNSFYYMAASVLASVGLSLLLSLFLRKNNALCRFLQASVFAPYVVSLVSVAFIWLWFMDADFGLLNCILKVFGIAPVGWLSDPKLALGSLVIVSAWKGLGFDTVILVSALQAIPRYLYEAAALDKAKPFAVFRFITLPMISPTLFFLALTNCIASFKVFETVALMTQGGPTNSTNVFVYFIYQNGFQFFKIGYASAAGVVLMAIIGVFTLVYFRVLDRKVHYR